MENKKFAFTLSEVLITLGVIGVVAAMTLPTLIKNYQKMVWVSQLKKSYSVIEQGFQKIMADEEVDKLSDVSFFSMLNSDEDVYCYSPNSEIQNTGNCKPLFDGLRKYFIGSYKKYGNDMCFLWNKNICDPNSDDGVLVLNDGTLLNLNFDNISLNSEKLIGGIWVDINGQKKPNTYGRDIFYFYIGNNGKLIPYGSKGQDGKCLNKDSDGTSCTARIIENGWKMDY